MIMQDARACMVAIPEAIPNQWVRNRDFVEDFVSYEIQEFIFYFKHFTFHGIKHCSCIS